MVSIYVNAGRQGSVIFGCALSCALLGGCSSKSDADTTPPLVFADCPKDLPGQKFGRTCATAQVPLRWDEPQGASIEVLVARYRAAAPSHGQLWMLDGGPGGTGAVYMDPDILALYSQLGLDVYVPQHRGTGHSTPLKCDPTVEVAACGAALVSEWGDGLRGFHSVEAGRDVGFLIQHASAQPEPAFVFGLSYGSYWAQRYLQAFPQQAKGVILEGVFPLGERVWEGDPLADAAGRSLFDACRKQPDCAAAFGDEDPEAVAQRVFASSADPALRCLGEEGVDQADLEAGLTGLIMGDLGAFIPGLMRRLDRCNASDQEQLASLGQVLGEALAVELDESVDNPALGVHVMRTDLMATLSQFPLEEMLAARAALIFWSGAAWTEQFAAMVEDWPVNYPAADATLPSAHSPVLLLNGGLDIQTPTPWARKLAPKLGGQLVEFPFAGHGVDISLASPFTIADPSCSVSILKAFVAAPGQPVDATCASTAYTPDVAGRSDNAQALATALYGADTPVLGDSAGPQLKRLGAPSTSPPPSRSRAEVTTAIRTRIRQARGSGYPR